MSEFEVPGSEEAILKAEQKGFVAVFPRTNQLQLDIDSNEGLQIYKRNQDIVKKYWGITNEEIHPSKSGGERKHVTITLSRNVSETERIALQAALGSDLRRELFGAVRCTLDDPYPTLFFEKEK